MAQGCKSTSRYQDLFRQMGDLVIIYEVDDDGVPGRILEANPKALETLGYDPAEMAGLRPCHVFDLGNLPPIHPEDQLNRDSPLFTTTLMCKDGRRLPVEVRCGLLHETDRTLGLALIRDVSERQRVERELKRQRDLFQQITDTNPAGITMVDKTGHITFVNPRGAQILGLSPDQVTRRTFDDVRWQITDLSGQPIPSDELPFSRVMAARDAIYDARHAVVHPDGGRVLLSINGAPVLDARGEVEAVVFTMIDITAQVHFEEELKASEETYRTILDSMEDAVFVHDMETGAILDVNRAMTRMYGYSAEEVAALDVGALSVNTPPYTQEEAVRRIKEAVAGRPQRFDWYSRAKSGRKFWSEVSLKRVTIGGKDRILAVERDISQRRESARQLELAAKVFENTIEGIVVTDPQANIQMVNPAFTQITGYTAAQALGKNPRILRSNRHPPEFYQDMWSSLISQGHWRGEIWNRRKSGEAYPEWLTITAIRDDNNTTTHYVAVFHDITETKRIQEHIKHQAYHDALTGLPNRLLFNDRLRQGIARARRHDEKLAVLFTDLDRFKTINDSLGHAVGDLLLQEVAQRLLVCVREEDTVSRLGGDEFILLLNDVKGQEDATRVAERMIQALERPIHLKGNDLYVSASVGIALFPADGEDRESLVKHADLAMYQAKELGRGRHHLYAPQMDQKAQSRLSVERELRLALETGQLAVHYQPQVNLATGRITAVEALVRWNHPKKGLVMPGRFIHVAEETGLIHPLGLQVLWESCRQARIWRSNGMPDLRVSVNLSPRQFGRHDLVDTVARTLETTGLPTEALELEITETVVLNPALGTQDALTRLHDMGVSLSLDDFGTGYSSLSLLRQFPLDTVKVDRSFVDGLPDNPDDGAICRAVIGLGKSLGLQVVAEGVETEAQLAYLKAQGCHTVQGYYFSPPRAPGDLEEFLRQGPLPVP